MARGYALTVGLNAVDPRHYQGWSGELNACEADAKDMAALLAGRGFEVRTLLTSEATRAAVTRAIAHAAEAAKPGDLFVYTNSSHGGQLPDLNGDEEDGKDETVCMYDGELVDDEIYALLAKFAAGVRILSLSDSCHSGTVTRLAPAGDLVVWQPPHGRVARAMPPQIALRTYRANRVIYDEILKDRALTTARDEVKASVLLISGCMENQTAMDGAFNGLFTETLLRVWNGGKFRGSHKKFWKKIVSLMPSDQTPNFFWASARDAAFERQTPFKI
jgi:hypothetical protein